MAANMMENSYGAYVTLVSVVGQIVDVNQIKDVLIEN